MSSGPSAVSGIPDAPAAFHGPLYAHLVGLGPATGFRLPLGDDAEAAVVAALDAFLCGAEAADPASSAAPAVIAARRRLFGDPDADSEDKDLPLEYRKTQMGKACGHVFKKGEAVWRCRCVLLLAAGWNRRRLRGMKR